MSMIGELILIVSIHILAMFIVIHRKWYELQLDFYIKWRNKIIISVYIEDIQIKIVGLNEYLNRVIAKKIVERDGYLSKRDLININESIFIIINNDLYWNYQIDGNIVVLVAPNGVRYELEPDNDDMYDFKNCKCIDLTRLAC